LDLRAAAIAAADASRRRVARPVHVAGGGNVSRTTTIAQLLLSANVTANVLLCSRLAIPTIKILPLTTVSFYLCLHHNFCTHT
jgi:hypothetical protein